MKYRVAEVFGPTVQGEGPFIGAQSYFVRFGGCDYRCSWCDSMHAVLPELVRQLPQMEAAELVAELENKLVPNSRPLIVLSGGNPCLWDLSEFIFLLRETLTQDVTIQVETQGTVWKDWLAGVDHIVVSPKPPSSGMQTDWVQLGEFLTRVDDESYAPWTLKVVVFDEADLEYAFTVADTFLSSGEMYLSCGTDANDTTETLLARYKWLIEAALARQVAQSRDYIVRIHPQMHVLVWGHALGV